MGWISEGNRCNHQYYGEYCNSARRQGFKPLNYEEWKSFGCPKKFKKPITIKKEKSDNVSDFNADIHDGACSCYDWSTGKCLLHSGKYCDYCYSDSIKDFY